MLIIIDIHVRAKLLHVVYASIEQKKRMKVVLRLKVRGTFATFHSRCSHFVEVLRW